MSKTAPRPVDPHLLGKAALRVGAGRADTDIGLTLAAVGLVIASMPSAPRQVRLPSLAEVARLLPRGCAPNAAAVLSTADGIVDWLAASADIELALTPAAGNA